MNFPLIRFILPVLLALAFAGQPLRAASCTDAACVQVSGRVASVNIDLDRVLLLNALHSPLLDGNINLSIGDWRALADANINLLPLLQALQAQATLGSPDAAFTTDISAITFFAAAANVLQANGQTAAATALGKLSAQTGLGVVKLSELIDLCSSCTSYANVNFNVLDLVGGYAEFFNFKNVAATTQGPITINANLLGLASLGTVSLWAQVCEPPRIVCGPDVTTFYGATIRLRLDLALSTVDLTAGLNVLGLASLHAQLTNLSVYVAIARVQGTVETVDALASAVTVKARPGVVDVYVGNIDQTDFFTKSRAIVPGDLKYGTVGAVQVTLLTIPITAAIKARASGQGESPVMTTLLFGGPYPQKKTVVTNLNFITNLVSSVLTTLDMRVEVDGYGLIGGLLKIAVDTLFNGILFNNTLFAVLKNAILTPLGLLLNSIVNPLLTGLGIRLGEADVIVLGAHRNCSYTVSGSVYRDGNRNGFKDGAETGNVSQTLWAKLVPATAPTGPATQTVSVNATTGAFSFSGVTTGTYTVVLSGNSTPADVAAVAIPAGWTMTEQGTRQRTVVVGVADVPNQNFGYAPFTSVAGQVFRDSGTGALATQANDGIRNGSETGLANVTMRLLDATNTVLDTTQTAGDGSYQLYIPATTAAGSVLRVIESNLPDETSTGASVGTTAGAYVRATDTVTFTFAANTSYTGVNFGDVPMPRLMADGQQSTTPGTTVTYNHQFIAGTRGSVTFGLTPTRTPATVAGWTETLYLDANDNGQLDATDPVLTGSTNVTEGQVLNLIVKVFAPETAPNGAQDSAVLGATFTFTNAAPALSLPLARTDLTIISNSTTAGLKLVKTVDKATALPGDLLVYTITLTNQAAAPLRTVVVTDMTPAFTKFVSATTSTLPAGFTLGSLTKPAVNATGALKWTFAGDLLPGVPVTVTFTVLVDL